MVATHIRKECVGLREENEANPVIISNSLGKEEESQLVEVLKKHKAATGWHISDLKGISPSYCMHKINMEADYKPSTTITNQSWIPSNM